MSTEQKYSGVGDSTTFFEPTAAPIPSTVTTAAHPLASSDEQQPDLLTAEQFISHNTDLIGARLTPERLNDQLTKRLRATPVIYRNILDGIALFRAFVGSSGRHPERHYALLLDDLTIIGLVEVTPDEKTPKGELPTWDKDNRALMRHILEAEANKVLMATVYHKRVIPLSAEDEIAHVRELFAGFGTEHLDWLFLFADVNTGYVPMTMSEDSYDEGVTLAMYEKHYVGFGKRSFIVTTDR